MLGPRRADIRDGVRNLPTHDLPSEDAEETEDTTYAFVQTMLSALADWRWESLIMATLPRGTYACSQTIKQ